MTINSKITSELLDHNNLKNSKQLQSYDIDSFTYEKSQNYIVLILKTVGDDSDKDISIIQINGPSVNLEKVSTKIYRYIEPEDEVETPRVFQAIIKFQNGITKTKNLIVAIPISIYYLTSSIYPITVTESLKINSISKVSGRFTNDLYIPSVSRESLRPSFKNMTGVFKIALLNYFYRNNSNVFEANSIEFKSISGSFKNPLRIYDSGLDNLKINIKTISGIFRRLLIEYSFYNYEKINLELKSIEVVEHKVLFNTFESYLISNTDNPIEENETIEDPVEIITGGTIDNSKLIVNLSFEGTNNSTSIIDTGTGNLTWGPSGNAKISTSAIYSGSSSLNTDGYSYISTPSYDAPALDLGLQDFTISFSFQVSSFKSYNYLLSKNYGSDRFHFSVNSSAISVSVNSGYGLAVQTAIEINKWYNVHFIRKDQIMYLYLDLTREIDSTNWGSQSLKLNDNSLVIGGCAWDSSAGLNGYIDNFKIYKGLSVFPEDTTVNELYSYLDFETSVNKDNSGTDWTMPASTASTTTSAYKGTKALACNGDSQYLQKYIDFENEDYLIEFYLKFNFIAQAGYHYGIIDYGNGSLGINGFNFTQMSSSESGVSYLWLRTEYSSIIQYGQPVVTGKWYKINIKYKESNLSLIVDDVIVGTIAITDPLRFSGNKPFFVGYANTDWKQYGNFIIDEFKIYKGISEIPTESLENEVTNYDILLKFEGEDNSTTIKDITGNTDWINNNAIIKTAQKASGNSSILFNGTNSYLNLASNTLLNFGTGDFTVSFNINPNSRINWYQTILSNGYTSFQTGCRFIMLYGNLGTDADPNYQYSYNGQLYDSLQEAGNARAEDYGSNIVATNCRMFNGEYWGCAFLNTDTNYASNDQIGPRVNRVTSLPATHPLASEINGRIAIGGFDGSPIDTSFNPLLWSTDPIPLNEWTKITITRKGTLLKLYINNVLDKKINTNKSFDFSELSTNIGKNNWDGNDGYYSGYLDNFYILKGLALEPIDSGIIHDYPIDLERLDVFKNNWYVYSNAAGTVPTLRNSVNKEALYFDGNCCLYNTNEHKNFGLSSFTVEMYMTLSGSLNYPRIFCGVNSLWYLYISTQGQIVFSNGSVETASLSNTINAGIRYHIALTRDISKILRVFVNGTKVIEKADETCYYSSTEPMNYPFYLGQNWNSRGSVNYPYNFTGLIDDFHIIRGECKYNANFTPSMNEAIVSTPSSLLNFNQSGTITTTTDINNNITWESAGITVSNTQTKFRTKSAHFDATNSYFLSNSRNEFKLDSNDFTIDMIVYVSQTLANTVLLDMRKDGESSYKGLLLTQPTASPASLTLSVGSLTANSGFDLVLNSGSNTLLENAWNHIRIVRHIGKLYLYLNGIVYNSGDYIKDIATSNYCYIGNNSLKTKGFGGYIEQFRLLNGSAISNRNISQITKELI